MGCWGYHTNENDECGDFEGDFLERYYSPNGGGDCNSDDYDYDDLFAIACQDTDRFNKLDQFLEGYICEDYHVGLCLFFIENDKLPENFLESLRLKIVEYLESRITEVDDFDDPIKRTKALNKELFVFSRGTKGYMEEDV
jgi:hypothetical protein